MLVVPDADMAVVYWPLAHRKRSRCGRAPSFSRRLQRKCKTTLSIKTTSLAFRYLLNTMRYPPLRVACLGRVVTVCVMWLAELGDPAQDLEWQHPRRCRLPERVRYVSHNLLHVGSKANTVCAPSNNMQRLTVAGLCRREAIDRRFAGDLRVYDQNLLRLGWIKGLKANVLVNLCCLGLFAPKLIAFEPFPVSDNLRYPTQRIRVRHCRTLRLALHMRVLTASAF